MLCLFTLKLSFALICALVCTYLYRNDKEEFYKLGTEFPVDFLYKSGSYYYTKSICVNVNLN